MLWIDMQLTHELTSGKINLACKLLPDQKHGIAKH
jgi:hypothetical protein